MFHIKEKKRARSLEDGLAVVLGHPVGSSRNRLQQLHLNPVEGFCCVGGDECHGAATGPLNSFLQDSSGSGLLAWTRKLVLPCVFIWALGSSESKWME